MLGKTPIWAILCLPLDLRSGGRYKETLYKTGNAYDLQNYGKRMFKRLTSNPKMHIKTRFFVWLVELTNINLRRAGADDRAVKRTLLFHSLLERA